MFCEQRQYRHIQGDVWLGVYIYFIYTTHILYTHIYFTYESKIFLFWVFCTIQFFQNHSFCYHPIWSCLMLFICRWRAFTTVSLLADNFTDIHRQFHTFCPIYSRAKKTSNHNFSYISGQMITYIYKIFPKFWLSVPPTKPEHLVWHITNSKLFEQALTQKERSTIYLFLFVCVSASASHSLLRVSLMWQGTQLCTTWCDKR